MLDGHSSLVEALRRHLSMWNIPVNDGEPSVPISFDANITEEGDDTDVAIDTQDMVVNV